MDDSNRTLKREESTQPVSGKPRGGRGAGAKYQRILDAALTLFAQKGFHTARLSDIASLAGVADGTVYLYFKNKDEILMSAINTAFDAFVARARAALRQLSSPVEKLRRLVRLHLETLGNNRSMAVVCQMELRQSARFLAQFSNQRMIEYFDIAREAIREGQERGLLRRELNEVVAARCLFGAVDETVTSWVLAEHQYPLPDVADAVADIILVGLEKRTNR